MSDIIGLKVRARQIRNATLEGENTAARVGSLFEDIIDCLNGSSGGDSEDSISVRSFLNTGVKIAEFTKGTSITSIYAPTTGSGGGGGGGSSAYDDTDLWNALNALDKTLDSTTDLANEEKARLDDLVKGIGDDISGRMKDALDFAAWILGNFPQGETTFRSGWDAKAQQFLQTVGLWDTDAETTLTMWSNYRQSYNDIMMTVSAVTESEDFTTFLQSKITQGISEGSISINLDTVYANKDEVDDVLTWLYSGLKNQSSADKTFNDLVSAARSGDSTGITELRTLILLLHDNKIVATTDLASKVDDALAELYQEVSDNFAKTHIFTTIDKASSDIAAIMLGTTGSESTVNIATRLANWKAGLVTTANKSESIVSLLAANSDNTAATYIAAIVNSNGSTAKISANHIELTGITTVYDTNGEPIVECNSTGIHMGYGPSAGTGHSRLNISEGVITSDVRSSSHTWESYELGYDGFEISSGNDSDSGHTFTTAITSQSIDISEAGGTGAAADAYHTALSDKGIRIYQPISGSSVIDLFTVTVDPSTRETDLFVKNDITANGEITASDGFNLGIYNFKVITIGSSKSTYLRISPNNGTTGVYMNASGRLGVVVNNSFKPGLDFDEYYSHHSTRTPGLGEFLTNTGSDINNYYIRNGLIVKEKDN